MTDPAVLTVAEVAGLLRVSTWTVGAMARDGRLPRVPGLGRVRILRHRDIATTLRYIGQTPESLRAAAASIEEAMG